MNLPSLAFLAHGMSADPLRVRQLIAQVLHLLPRLDTRHFRNVVVIETLGMLGDKIENLFFICHVRESITKIKSK